MSELSYNPGADAIFDNSMPKGFKSRKYEDMTKYPTIVYFKDQSLTVFSNLKTKLSVELLIKKYNGRKGKYNTRGSRPIVVESIKEIND